MQSLTVNSPVTASKPTCTGKKCKFLSDLSLYYYSLKVQLCIYLKHFLSTLERKRDYKADLTCMFEVHGRRNIWFHLMGLLRFNLIFQCLFLSI